MDQELDEFDLLWPDHEASSSPAAAAASTEISSPMPRPKQRCTARSPPVDVPRAALILRRLKDEGEEEDQEEDDGGGGSSKKINIVVPPHLMLSVVRRPDGETPAAWSASTLRSGRPHKRARDLRLLRNSVLRMTGFIEG